MRDCLSSQIDSSMCMYAGQQSHTQSCVLAILNMSSLYMWNLKSTRGIVIIFREVFPLLTCHVNRCCHKCLVQLLAHSPIPGTGVSCMHIHGTVHYSKLHSLGCFSISHRLRYKVTGKDEQNVKIWFAGKIHIFYYQYFLFKHCSVSQKIIV